MNESRTSLEEVTSAIFVDMPNVERRNGEHLRIRWKRLFSQVKKEIEGTLLVHAGMYSGVGSSLSWGYIDHLRNLEAEFGRRGYEFHTRQARDIDSWIVNDIWMSIARTQELTVTESEVLLYPLRVKHILVSGDGGYLRAYRSLKHVYGDDIEIELVVIGWHSSVSHELSEMATEIRYLDDIPDLIREP